MKKCVLPNEALICLFQERRTYVCLPLHYVKQTGGAPRSQEREWNSGLNTLESQGDFQSPRVQLWVTSTSHQSPGFLSPRTQRAPVPRAHPPSQARTVPGGSRGPGWPRWRPPEPAPRSHFTSRAGRMPAAAGSTAAIGLRLSPLLVQQTGALCVFNRYHGHGRS